MRNLILSLLVLTAGCAATPREIAASQARDASDQEKLGKALAGLTPGKPVTCIDQIRTRQVAGYGPTILYTVNNGLIYRSDTAGGCSNVGRDVLVTRTISGQLCRGDIAQTVDSSSRFPTGSCSFGDFIPYRKQ